MSHLKKILFYSTLTFGLIYGYFETGQSDSGLETPNVIPIVPTNTCYDTLNNKDFQCDSEMCSTILTCEKNVSKPINSGQCNPDKPYCAIGLTSDYCSDVMDGQNVACAVKETFKCGRTGIFPNPRHCQVYYNCTTKGMFVEPSSCPIGKYFNSRTATCDLLVHELQCFYAKCPSQGLFSVQVNPFYYYQCYGNPLKAVMHRCNRNEVFSSKGCTFNCRILGNHAHEDEKKYYECFLIKGKWQYAIRNCHNGKYDPIKRKCVAE